MGAAILLMASALSFAASGPAPWFVWQSTLDGQLTCAQSAPGKHWEKVRGPYRDRNCTLPTSYKTS